MATSSGAADLNWLASNPPKCALDGRVEPCVLATISQRDEIFKMVDELPIFLHQWPFVLNEINNAGLIPLSRLIHGHKRLRLHQKLT